MENAVTTKVFLANIGDVLREGIKSLLDERPTVQVVGSSDALSTVIEQAHELRPHFVLIGLLRRGIDAVETIKGIRRELPAIAVIGLIIDSDVFREAPVGAKGAGAHAYLSLNCRKEELWELLEQLSVVPKAVAYKQRLQELPIGDGKGYESFCEEVIPFLFEPHFTRFERQVRRSTGDQPDLVCKNQGGHSFCKTIRDEDNARYVVFEFKNEATPTLEHWRQLASFLKPTIGRFGILLVREQPKRQRTLYTHLSSFYAKNSMLIPLYDQDVLTMLDMRIDLQEPMDHLERRYDHYIVHI